MKCRVHPKYKALRKPTSKARGCTCKKVFRPHSKARRAGFRDKKTRPSDATLIKKWGEKEREYRGYMEENDARDDKRTAGRYEGISIAFRWCREDLQGK